MTVSVTVKVHEQVDVQRLVDRYDGKIIKTQSPQGWIKTSNVDMNTKEGRRQNERELGQAIMSDDFMSRFSEQIRKPTNIVIRFPDIDTENLFIEEFKSFYESDQIRRMDRNVL